MTLFKALVVGAAIALPAGILVTGSFAQTNGAPARDALRAGAARVDITPAVADLPEPFKTIHDPIFVRALVIDDGKNRAVVVVGDLPTIAVPEFEELKRRIAATAHAPVQNVLLAVTHAHSAVRIDHVVQGISIPGSPKIADMTMAATVEAVKQATAKLQPARAGYAEQGDHTVAVLKVESRAGDPIAFLFNSDLPGVGPGSDSEVGAGAPGAVQRFIERRYGDKAVAIYTKGASGGPPANGGGRAGGGAGAPTDPNARLAAMGAAVGGQVLTLAEQTHPTSDLKVSGSAKVLQCPGKSTSPLNLPNRCSDAPGSKLPACVFKDTDIDPVKLQVGVLRIGDLSLVQADADITQPVWQRFRSAAPANTLLVSLVYGPVHYVIEDSVYAANGYQATASMAKKGCAADGFVTAATEMTRRP